MSFSDEQTVVITSKREKRKMRISKNSLDLFSKYLFFSSFLECLHAYKPL